MTDNRYDGNVLCMPIGIINRYLTITGECDINLVQQFNEQVKLIK